MKKKHICTTVQDTERILQTTWQAAPLLKLKKEPHERVWKFIFL